MLLFVNVFRLAWQPFFLETAEQEDAKRVFSRVLTYFLFITSGVFLAISFFVDDLVRFEIGGSTFFGSAYWGGTHLVPLFLAAYILYGLYVNLIAGVYIEKKTLYLPLVAGAAALTSIGANLWLIPHYGMSGAAVASVLAYSVMVCGLFVLSRRYYPIPYEWSRLARIALVVILLYMVGNLSGDLHWGYRAALLGAYPVVLYVTGFFTGGEFALLRRRAGL